MKYYSNTYCELIGVKVKEHRSKRFSLAVFLIEKNLN